MTLIVGLTGGIASGKSTISSYFQSLHIPVIDADIEARLAVEKGESAYNQIVSHFGKKILQEDGDIDRSKLGDIIFVDEKKRLILNNIVHPEVRKRMDRKQEAAVKAGEKVVILDIPLLFENKLNESVDKTILVYVEEDIQVERLMKRNTLTFEQAISRIRAQMSLNDKKKLADEYINNNGTIEESKIQALNILKKWNAWQE